MNMVKQLLQFALKIVIFNLLKGTFLMKFNDSKTFSAYVRPKLHSSYITVLMQKPKKSYKKDWLISGKDLKISGPIEWL